MADELRERVAEALAEHETDLHDFVGDDGDIAVYRWACACGEDGEAETEGDAMDAEQAHLADAVLAALDLDARVAAAVERGRREAAEVAALMGQHFDKTAAPGLLRDGVPDYAVAAMRAKDVLAALGSDTIRPELLAWAASEREQDGEGRCTCPDVDINLAADGSIQRTVRRLDPRCPEHGKGTG